ncbi:hypothetical protein Dimus_038216 [Dionaea muscipula]
MISLWNMRPSFSVRTTLSSITTHATDPQPCSDQSYFQRGAERHSAFRGAFGASRHRVTSSNHGVKFSQGVVCQYCDKKDHTVIACFKLKCQLGVPVPPCVNYTGARLGGSPSWLLDTDASHITSDLSNLSFRNTYDGRDDVLIDECDGRGLSITHTGHFALSSLTQSFRLNNVLSIKLNLNSVSQFYK